jgi:uncharacterized membrane protein YhaH (DUF805 family)
LIVVNKTEQILDGEQAKAHGAWDCQLPMPPLITAFTSAWEKSLHFSGRSTRGDYWWFVLANVIVSFVLNLASLLGRFFYSLAALYMVAAILPSLALTIRRLRDAGKHWAWVFIGLLPIIGTVWFIWLMVQPSALPLA